jgi:hypothetical protein
MNIVRNAFLVLMEVAGCTVLCSAAALKQGERRRTSNSFTYDSGIIRKASNTLHRVTASLDHSTYPLYIGKGCE